MSENKNTPTGENEENKEVKNSEQPPTGDAQPPKGDEQKFA